MFIAIPTNDRINIEQKSGRTKEFAILDLENSEEISYLKNPHNHGVEEKNHVHSHESMVAMFRENKVEILIVDIVGKHFKKDLFEADIKIYKTKLTNLTEIVSSFKNDINSFDEVLG